MKTQKVGKVCKSCRRPVDADQATVIEHTFVFTADPEDIYGQPEIRSFTDTLCGRTACNTLNDLEAAWTSHTQVCPSQDEMRDPECFSCAQINRELWQARQACQA